MASNLKATNHSIGRVIEVIRLHREVSRRVIAKETGLSTPSITRLVNGLIVAEILSVNESTTAEGAGPGRPASVVKFNADHCCSIGVDVGEHLIQTSLGNLSGNVLLTSGTASGAELGGETTVENIVRAIREVYQRYETSFEGETVPPLRAIAVGVPGTVDPDGVRVISAPNIKGWNGLLLQRRLSDQFPDVSIRIVNDINAAAIAEEAHGVAHGCSDFVFASFRQGIGAGIFVNGELYRGASGYAGEIGKMAFESDFQFSKEDNLGFLEKQYGESPLIEAALRRGVVLEPADSGKPAMRSLCKAAANGNAAAMEIVEQALTHYGVAIANIATILAPEMIVVGGEIHAVMDIAVDRIQETMKRLIPNPPKVLGSALAEKAVLRGALYQSHKDACDTLLDFATNVH